VVEVEFGGWRRLNLVGCGGRLKSDMTFVPTWWWLVPSSLREPGMCLLIIVEERDGIGSAALGVAMHLIIV